MQETYNIEKRDWAAKLMAIVVVVTMVTSTFVLFAPEASAKTGSDSYGYEYKDSAEVDGPTYAWVDILSTGTSILCGAGQVCSTDGAQGPFNIGFDFTFYGKTFNTFFNAGDNGFISLGGAASSYTSATIPSGAAGSYSVIGGWFDGGFCKTQQANSGVYYQTMGDAGSRKLVVTMQDQVNYYVRDGTSSCRFGYASATDTITWQIILEEATGNVLVQYKDAVGGYYADNEVLASGIQGTYEGTLYGIEYMARSNSANIPDNTAVLYMPPPPKQNDLKLDSTAIPNPISLAEDNVLGATVYNNGVNCSTPGSCDPQPETNIDVTAKVFSVKETVSEYNFDDRSDDNGFTTESLNGGANMWTQDLDDGTGDYNYGSEGTTDGSWSTGRKSTTLSAAFTDQQSIHYDGTSILVADYGTDSIKQINTASQAVTTLIGPDSTNLNYVLDVTSDADNYYTLSKTYSWSSAVRVCKWDKDSLSAPTTCNTANVKYGTALTVYGTEIFVLQTSFSSSYRKVVTLDTTNLALQSKSIGYGSGMYGGYYSQDLDVDQATGDIYIVYRNTPGTIRAYHRAVDGTYGTTSAYYTQVSTGARIPIGVEVHDGFAYVHGFYGYSSYGGMKKISTTNQAITALWPSTNYGGQYSGSIAVTDDGDIYLSSNYKYSYSSFRNNKDAVWFWDAADYGTTPTKMLGPAPGSLSALVSPVIDAENAVGLTVSFDMSHNFYYNYGGAYFEASRDNGVTWEYVGKESVSGNQYYGPINAYYGNAIDTKLDTWTRHDTNHIYSRYSNTEDWKTTTITLDEFTGNAQVKFRIVVGYDIYGRSYLDSFFRVDDISIALKEADTIFVQETKTIASLDFKGSETVTFFESDGDNTFKPSMRGLSVGDTVGISINVPGNANDLDKTNQRVVVFREVKYVIFADSFDEGDKGWTTGTIKYGASTWAIRDNDAVSGANSMDSGYRNQAQVPGDPYISTPILDLGLPVEASLQMKVSWYAYYTYDGYQAQISEDGGATWDMIEPEGGYKDRNGVSRSIYADSTGYWGNPLRGKPGLTYYGSSTGYTSSPDPQDFVDLVFNLDDYTGQDDIKFRWVAGWSRLYQWSGAYNSFLRFDDFAVTGLVYNDNVGLSELELTDPIGIDETVTLSSTVINAGINDQTAGAAKVRLQVGPMGLQTYDSSDDLESYTSLADAETAGWSTDSECNTVYSTCSSWGTPAGSTIVADGDSTAFGPGTNGFMMYSGAGTTSVTSPKLDFTGAENDLKLTLKHRYNFDYRAGLSATYNGGNVQISTDDGTTWSLFTPSEGYSASIGGYASYGNPLFGESAFVHCGDCTGVSGTASANEDKYIETEFDMSKYVDETEVRLKFVTGMWKYQSTTYGGEHWYIDSLQFLATGMESIVYEQTVAVSNSANAGGVFAQGNKFTMSKDYRFQVPGEYKIVFEAWIGAEGTGDDFAGDNIAQAIRETMFTVEGTTADSTATSTRNDGDGKRYYTDGWVSSKDGGPVGGYQWAPSETSDASSPVWSIGTDARGTRPNGDDVSLTSAVVDLSQATSAKLVFDHRYAFYASTGTYITYYDGGRVEISTDEGVTWAALAVTGGEMYGGPEGTSKISTSTYYGNPLRGQSAFVGTSSLGADKFVSSECDLTSYMGAGFESVMLRFRMGGGFSDWGSSWEMDNIGIYGLGFDLAQGTTSMPYTLEVGESATITTSFSNQGKGDLGSSGPVAAAYAYAFVNDMSGNTLWSDITALDNLDMAAFGEDYVVDGNEKWLPTSAGESTPTMTFNFEGKDNGGNTLPAGVYTIGAMVSDADGKMLSDLFPGNNIDSHMLMIGRSADIGSPMLAGGPSWAASTNTPAEVGEALAVAWDQSDVATGTLNIDIGSTGYSVVDSKVAKGTTITWTNRDTASHTVTDLNGEFDSMSIGPGASWSLKMTEIGNYNYNSISPSDSMAGTITVLATASVDEQARTNFVNIWSSDSYLYFWSKYDLSENSLVSVYAQKKGSELDGAGTIALSEANGFQMMDGSDHSEVGESTLSGMGDWKPYYIHLDSNKLGYNTLQYVPEQDNSYSFVFRARGVQGSVEIGNVQLIRTLDTGFFFAKDDESKLTHEIFPSLAVDIDYFVKNIGTESNHFQFTPYLAAQGNEYGECSIDAKLIQSDCEAKNGTWSGVHNWVGLAFTVSVEIMLNGNEYSDMTSTKNADGTWTYDLELNPDDQAIITVRFLAPDYDSEKAEPAGNRKFDVKLAPYDTGSDKDMREPISANLFIKPSQFVLGEMDFDRKGVLEGDPLSITVEAWNEGNYASDVLVVVYVVDPSGDAYNTPAGVQRLTRVASAIQPVMAPKDVLMTQPGDFNGHARTWYPVTAVWEEVFIPVTTNADYEIVELYAMINPDPEQQDLDNGFKKQDEYLNQKDDNDATGSISVVKDKSSTPSFALGILGMSVAALIAAAGASLRREEE